jgi:hypothetical protein
VIEVRACRGSSHFLRAAFVLLMFCPVAQAQQIDPERHCIMMPGSSECRPMSPEEQYPQYAPQPRSPYSIAETGDFIFCHAEQEMGTKALIVSDIFQSREKPSNLAAQFTAAERANGVPADFTCTADRSRDAQTEKLQRLIASYARRGFHISRVTHP